MHMRTCVCPHSVCVHVHMCACVYLHVWCMHTCVDVEDAGCPTLSIFGLTSSLDKGSLTDPGARLGATKPQSPSCPHLPKAGAKPYPDFCVGVGD